MTRRLWIVAILTLLLLPAAHAFDGNGQDYVQFFQNIHIRQDQTAEDTVCIFCSVQVDGTLTGDAVVIFGQIKNSGRIHGDAVAILGSTTLTGDASIDGDAVAIGGWLNVSPTATVSGDHVTIPAMVILLQLLLLAGILIALIYGIVWLIRRSRQPVYPMRPR
ncbi:MAG: hypothetical protein ACYC46_08490 [Acidobacteriaceae bacterium]